MQHMIMYDMNPSTNFHNLVAYINYYYVQYAN